MRKSVLLAAVGLALALSGCKEEEQDRVLNYEPGVYKGQKDSPLQDETVDTLRQRQKQQGRL